MTIRLLKRPDQTWLNAAHYEAVCSFDLSFSLRVINRCVIELDAHLCAPVFDLLGREIGSVISYYTVRDTITVYHAGYEVDYWSGLG